MTKRTHVLFGAATTLPFTTWNNAIFFPIVLLGSTAADWDYIIGLKHRWITHTLLALTISTIVVCIFSLNLGLLWGLNYGGHLFLDSLTITGVPLLYPFNKKYYGLKIFKTRGAEDLLLSIMLLYLIVTLID